MIAIPLLLELVIVLVFIALAGSVKYFAQMLGHAVGSGGWIGAIVNFLTGGIVTRAENAISHWAGRAVQGIDATVGTAFHALALTVDRIGGTLELVGTFSVEAAHAISGAVSVSHLTAIVRDIRHEVSTVAHDAELAIKHALANAKGLAVDVVHPLLKRLKELEHVVHHTLSRQVSHALSLAQSAEKSAADALTQVGQVLSAANVAVFAGAVAYAVSWLSGLNLQCDSLRNVAKNRKCGLWNGIDDVLALLFDAAIFADLCAVIPEVEKLFGEFEQPLTDLIASAADAVCAQPPPHWPEIPGRKLQTPTVVLSSLPNPAG